MAGHSHSANIKFRKARVDLVRAKTFTKLARMITVAAKLGGGDPDANPRLRLALDKARLVSVPRENIERAIKKGTGELENTNYEEILYEGYGPFGVAVMLEVLTDNKHRTAPELRRLFERAGGNLGATGAVAWMFERRAVFSLQLVEASTKSPSSDPDRLLELVLEAGAQDLVDLGHRAFEVHGDPGSFMAIKTALETEGVKMSDAGVAYVPKVRAVVSELDQARKVVALMDLLEDHDDVQNAFANYDFPDAVAVELGKE